MKQFSVISIIAVALFCGCATQRQVANLEGHGDRRTYDASFDQVWRAAVDAAQQSDLQIVTADRTTGYIGAQRTIQPHTFGENVGVWVRNLAPAKTEVEVVSRQAGPPVAWLKNWEHEIHNAIAVNLTREPPAVGAAPGQTIIERGSSTVVVPATPSGGQVVVVPGTASEPPGVLDQRRRVDALRNELQERRNAFNAETDAARRDAIEREIDRLNSDLQAEDQKLREMRR